ncbi:unnamed protein product [Caenorhabditis angaria]|uniref:Uncharacterized protein n=1 Tax=Caenorhabditis angaria TaxID=860376 RepID=A0A9P1INT8_9PELO|nr:unnamed protein product [Caenorhabditis angaria]
MFYFLSLVLICEVGGNGVDFREDQNSADREKKLVVLEDLIEVQRKYRELKEKWTKIKGEDKNNKQEEEEEKFESTTSFLPKSTIIAENNLVNSDEMDDEESFVEITDEFIDDISKKSPAEQLEEIQHLISDAFQKNKNNTENTSDPIMDMLPIPAPSRSMKIEVQEDDQKIQILTTRTTISPVVPSTVPAFFDIKIKPSDVPIVIQNKKVPKNILRDPENLVGNIQPKNRHLGDVPKKLQIIGETSEEEEIPPKPSEEVTLDQVLRSQNPEKILNLVPLQEIPQKMQSFGTTSRLKYQEKQNFVDPKLESLLKNEVAQLQANLPTRLIMTSNNSSGAGRMGIFPTSTFPKPPPLPPLSFGIERDLDSNLNSDSEIAFQTSTPKNQDEFQNRATTTAEMMMIKKFFDEEESVPRVKTATKKLIDNDTLAGAQRKLKSKGISKKTPKKINETSILKLPAWGASEIVKLVTTTSMPTVGTLPPPPSISSQNSPQKRDSDFHQIEIDKLIFKNQEARSDIPRCSRIFGKEMDSLQIVQISRNMGLFDISKTIEDAETTENPIIIDDEIDRILEEKRNLVGKLEVLLSLSESRALIFDLLEIQKSVIEKLENAALDMIENLIKTTTTLQAEKSVEEMAADIESNFVTEENSSNLEEMPEPIVNFKTNLISVPRPNINGLYMFRRPLPIAPPTMKPIQQLELLATPKPQASAARIHVPSLSAQEDIIEIPADDREVCKQVECDFEQGLCNFESSHDETTRLHHQIRQKRSFSEDILDDIDNVAEDLLPFTFRAWSIWTGRWENTQKQIDIGPIFKPQKSHFAGVFLEPEQAAILSTPLILTGRSTTIRFMLFEASRGMRLRVCCDRFCPMETENGLFRGHRKWIKRSVTCPPNTQSISFECLNSGAERGACGIDEIFVKHPKCAQFFQGADQR